MWGTILVSGKQTSCVQEAKWLLLSNYETQSVKILGRILAANSLVP